MSHYDLEPLTSRYEISIGWDPPLGSFLLQVRDREIDETQQDPVIVWMGADWPATEIKVDQLLLEASQWAILPEDLRPGLLTDRATEGTRPSPPFLRWMVQDGPPVT